MSYYPYQNDELDHVTNGYALTSLVVTVNTILPNGWAHEASFNGHARDLVLSACYDKPLLFMSDELLHLAEQVILSSDCWSAIRLLHTVVSEYLDSADIPSADKATLEEVLSVVASTEYKDPLPINKWRWDISFNRDD